MIRGGKPFRRINGTDSSELKWKRQAVGSGIRTKGSTASMHLLCALRLSDPTVRI